MLTASTGPKSAHDCWLTMHDMSRTTYYVNADVVAFESIVASGQEINSAGAPEATNVRTINACPNV